MRRPLAFTALLAGLSVAAAEEPPATGPASAKSRLYAPDPWKTDETVTETGTFKRSTFGNVPDGDPKPTPRVVSVEYEIVRHCTEADAAGHWTHGEAWIRRFLLVGGPTEDRSIEGAVVAVDADGKWRFVESKPEVSSSAKTWIEQNLAGRAVVAGDGDGVAPEDWPSDEVAVGVAVPVRLRGAERGYAKMGIPFPADGIAGAVVLAAVEATPAGPRITFSRTAEAKLEGTVKSGGRDLTYLPGSRARDSIQCSKVLGACHATASLKGETSIVTIVDAGKGPMRSEALVTTTMDRKAGGEMPAKK